MIHLGASLHHSGGPPMLFDGPACFRLDNIPVRPIHWLWRPYLACGKPAVRCGRPARAEGRPGFVAMVGSVSVCRVRADPSSPQGSTRCAMLSRPAFLRLLTVGAVAKACRPARGLMLSRGWEGYRLRTGPRKHGTLALPSGALWRGPIRPCRTASVDADEGKADRPPSCAVSALRPWPAANPKP